MGTDADAGAGTGVGTGSGDRARTRPRGRRVLLGALAWAGAVLLTGTVAWNAVAVISDEPARPGLLAREQVSAALAEARAAASAAPTPDPSGPGSPAPGEPSGSPTAEPGDEPTSGPTTSPGTSPGTSSSPGTSPSSTPQPPPAQATWVVAGGSVSVECTGAVIRLVAATPEDGWTVEVGSPGPEAVEVELHRSESETHVRAVCSGGTPVQVTGDAHKAEEPGREGSDD